MYEMEYSRWDHIKNRIAWIVRKVAGEGVIYFAAYESRFYVPGRGGLSHLENRAAFRGEN